MGYKKPTQEDFCVMGDKKGQNNIQRKQIKYVKNVRVKWKREMQNIVTKIKEEVNKTKYSIDNIKLEIYHKIKYTN